MLSQEGLECFGLAKTSTEFLIEYFDAAVGGGLDQERDGHVESCCLAVHETFDPLMLCWCCCARRFGVA